MDGIGRAGAPPRSSRLPLWIGMPLNVVVSLGLWCLALAPAIVAIERAL